MRLVVEHDDGRRVGVEDHSYDHPSGNPYNNSSRVVRAEDDSVHFTPARPSSEHISLKAEGFKVVGKINADGHECELTEQERRDYA